MSNMCIAGKRQCHNNFPFFLQPIHLNVVAQKCNSLCGQGHAPNNGLGIPCRCFEIRWPKSRHLLLPITCQTHVKTVDAAPSKWGWRNKYQHVGCCPSNASYTRWDCLRQPIDMECTSAKRFACCQGNAKHIGWACARLSTRMGGMDMPILFVVSAMANPYIQVGIVYTTQSRWNGVDMPSLSCATEATTPLTLGLSMRCQEVPNFAAAKKMQ